MVRKLTYSSAWPPQDDAIREALLQAYASGDWGKYHGPQGEALQEKIATNWGVDHVYPCSSGTIAVELGLRGGRIGPGDEVLLAGYDFPGNFRAIEAVGAKPVLLDLSPGTWTLDASQLAATVSPATRAIIVSHLHGTLAAMPQIMTWAREHQIYVVEDACQVPGAMIAGKLCGSFGDCGILSFGGSKLLTAGRGGCVITQQAEVMQRIKIYAERGNDSFPLSELQAAVLLPQLEQLARHNHRRSENVAYLRQQLADCQALVFPPQVAAEVVPSYYKLGLWLAAGNGRGSCEPAEWRESFLALARQANLPMDRGFRGFSRRSSQRCRTVGELTQSQIAADRTVLIHHPILLETQELLDEFIAVLCDILHTLNSQRTS